jgi:hypothetical protein
MLPGGKRVKKQKSRTSDGSAFSSRPGKLDASSAVYLAGGMGFEPGTTVGRPKSDKSENL